jgi:Ni,Fe-hydrogenase I small subunit
VSDIVADRPVINISGCPPIAREIKALVHAANPPRPIVSNTL